MAGKYKKGKVNLAKVVPSVVSRVCELKLASLAPGVMFSAPIPPDIMNIGVEETPVEREKRVWRHRSHVNSRGRVIIPGRMFHGCIVTAGSNIRMGVPGSSGSEYTKKFQGGVVLEDIELPMGREDLIEHEAFVPSNGKKGGPRVWRSFPQVPKWEGILRMTVFDKDIDDKAIVAHVRAAGLLIGIGFYRPQSLNKGTAGPYGRFQLVSMEWV